MASRAGYPPRKRNLNFIQEAAFINARRQIFPVWAFPAGTFRQITDFKIEQVSYNDHERKPLSGFSDTITSGFCLFKAKSSPEKVLDRARDRIY